MKDVFKRLITDFIEKDIQNILSRDYNIPLVSKKLSPRGCAKKREKLNSF